MMTEDFLKLTMQEVADLLAEEWSKTDNNYSACLARGLDDDNGPLCLSVILSEKPISTVSFEGENDE